MRVVADTSVWVSALLWTGLPHRILELAEQEAITLCMTPPLLDELQEVLGRPKFAAKLAERQINTEELIQGVLQLVALYPAPDEVETIIHADPDNDIVIHCAVAADAKCIVTGDDHLLSLESYRGILISTPREFLAKKFQDRLQAE